MAGVREQTDEEIVMEEIGDEDVTTLSDQAWSYVTEESTLLDLAETQGMKAVCAWLDARGLGWSPAQAPPRRERRPRLSPDQRCQAQAVLGERPPWVVTNPGI
jgi:hypothetical protein